MNAISYPINLTTEEILGIYIADIHDAFEAKNPEAAFLAVDAKVQVTLDIEKTLPGMLPEGLFETLTENRIPLKDFESRLRNPHF